MKKNKMMRLASLLLVCVLLTTSVIGGTFAKYVTVQSGSDNARVAAWGFGDATTVEFNLFTYTDANVKSSNNDKIIAPGTGNTATINFDYADTTGKGAPEVAYKVTLAVDTENTDIADAIKANPAITWSFGGTTYGSWDAMVTAINGYKEDVAAGKLPSFDTNGLTIGWKWEFLDTDAQNKTDTDMGNANPLDECKLAIKLTAAQVD